MEEKKWYRVTDPLNPLYGCDVTGFSTNEWKGWMSVTAMRRVDVFVGDRPFQLVAKAGETLGIMIDTYHLQESPIQDDVMETGTDRPHGACINEGEMTRPDGVTLRVADYERAIQIAVEDSDGQLLGTATETGPARDEWERQIIEMFEAGADAEDIAFCLEEN